MKKILILALFFIGVNTIAQNKIKKIDVLEISKLASEKEADGKFDEALEILNKINKNDSSYCSIQVTKSYYLIQLKKFDEAINIIDEAFSVDCIDSKRILYMNKAAALSNLDKEEEALIVYNEGLEIFPQNQKLWYSKALTLMELDRTEEAIEAYKKAILIDPRYRDPHLQLGNICYKQGKITQALMCYNMYILLMPDASNSLNALTFFNDLLSTKNENFPNDDLQISIDDESFEDIDLILTNKLALNDKYKIDNKIDIALIKQSHVMLSQLPDYEGNGGFWDRKYVQFFKWVLENDEFDNMAYTISYSIENEYYKKIVEKNNKNIIEFIGAYIPKWNEIITSDNSDDVAKEGDLFYYYDDYLKGLGIYKNNDVFGDWKLFNSNGQVISQGAFNENSNKNGKWEWFYKNQQLKESVVYKDGKLIGDYRSFHENGKPHIETTYKDDMIDGSYIYYNDRGALIQKKHFEKDSLEGLYQSYFNVGELLIEYSIPYTENKIEGTFQEFYANGKVYSELKYKKGLAVGVDRKYFNDGNKLSEIEYKDDKLNGSYVTYHHNGSINEKGQCLDGELVGQWKAFYDDGTIKIEYSYSYNKLHGSYKFYDIDGKIYYEYEYKKDEIIAFKYYDKKGNILIDKRKKGGKFYFTGYSKYGIKTGEGEYDITGGKIGDWKFYNSNGTITAKGNYIDGKIEGEYIDYYSNGNIKEINNYKNNLLEGYSVSYFTNEQIISQGWYKDNMRFGEWRTYYIDGTLKGIFFYHKDKLHGEQKDYAANGKLSKITTYKFGVKHIETYYGADGSIFDTIDYLTDKNLLTFKHPNNTLQVEITYKNGVFHGPYRSFTFEGNKRIEGNYLNGVENGTWTWYHDNGKVESERNYLEGKKHGKEIDYYENGIVKEEKEYLFNEIVGIEKSYNDKGILETKASYRFGELHGKKIFYSPTGELQLIRFYDQGRVIGYSYLGEDGKELPMIPIEKETGKITTYFQSGEVARTMEYLNGNFIGDYYSYYKNGQIASKNIYINGMRNGLNISYFPNGNIKKEIEFLHEYYQGPYKEYYENGNLKKITNYLCDDRNGETIYYNEDGNMTKKEIFFDGYVTSSETY